jgi:hypothetical protein
VSALFFFAPFVWVMVIPALFLSVVLIRALIWVRDLTRPTFRRERKPDERNYIEGEFVDEESLDVPQDEEGSPPHRDPLEK